MKCTIIFIITVFASGFLGYCTCAMLGAGKVSDLFTKIHELEIENRRLKNVD